MALNLGQSHGIKLAGLLAHKAIKKHIYNELAMVLENPIRFTSRTVKPSPTQSPTQSPKNKKACKSMTYRLNGGRWRNFLLTGSLLWM